jgi:predicted 3-demethylubiquinone-9 3-methyltransferase (glyoxalase superfamily)
VSWQVTPAILGPLLSGDPARAARVMSAFMQMQKFDIAALQAAARG